MSDYLKDLRENSPSILPVQEQENIHGKIVDFFKANPNPADEDVHKFSEEIGMDEHELEGHIYMVLTDYIENSIPLNKIGKHREVNDESFDPKELAMGIEIEYEHTDDATISKEIAKDHLAELPDYYTRLKKMEEEGKEESKNVSEQETSVSGNINPPESPGKAVRDEKPSEVCPFEAIKKVSKSIKGDEDLK